MQSLLLDFNKLPLKSQQSTADELSKASTGDMQTFYNNISRLLNYLDQTGKITESAVEIPGKDDEHFSNLTNDRRVQLNFKTTEIIYESKSIESSEFLDIAKSFTEFCFEVKYPSPNFDQIYDHLINLKKNTEPKEKISISIFISGIKETDQRFNKAKLISYVKLDTTVTEIKSTEDDRGSFMNCKNLKEIIIPSTVTSIGISSFQDCCSLKSVIIPPSLTIIDANVFNGCSSITEVTIPSSVTEISWAAFSNCYSLNKVTFEEPVSVTEIGSDAFGGCRSLKEFVIPPLVTKIESRTFDSCSEMTSISIPPSVTEIKFSAFHLCTSLTKITIPSFVTSIGKGAFKGCSKLEEITVPSSLDLSEVEFWSKTIKINKV